MVDRGDPAQIEQIGALFHEIMTCLQGLHGEDWVGMELSMAQFKALMLICSTGGLPGRELAQRLGVGPSAITPIIDKLVRHGYVRREEDSADRRLCWARPTTAGTALNRRMIAAGREGLEDILASLPPGELAQVEDTLNLLHRAALSRADQVKRERDRQCARLPSRRQREMSGKC